MVVADLIGREADGSEDCGEHCGEDTELGHVRRKLFAKLGEVGASAAAAAASQLQLPLRPLHPLHPLQLQLQPSHRRCPSALGRA